ncbi:MAG: hypothetical protein R3A13_00445 [Bdellovibrionota bacterium]
MPRRRRRIISNQVYEICFRAREGLPLVCYDFMKLIINSVLARTQRDNKVILCHDIWNGSHPHLIVVAKDSEQFVQFYSEVQKKITDIIKRLLGLDHLSIWEGYPSVIEIAGVDEAISRIAYLYANPAQDNLEESIEKFPGCSSYREFRKLENKLDASISKKCPWIRLPSVKKLKRTILTKAEDRKLVLRLRNKNRKQHLLVRRPNAWMSAFGISDDTEVKVNNDKMLELLHHLEREAAKLREFDKKPVMGAKKLQEQSLMKPHKPKKKSVKVFIYCHCNKLRKEAIKAFDDFCDKCRRCYLEWKRGNFNVEWPPGAFKPPLPPNCNVLA